MFFCESNPDFVWKVEDLLEVESKLKQEGEYCIISFVEKCELECLRISFDTEVNKEDIEKITLEFVKEGEWKQIDKKGFLGDKIGEVIIPLNEEYLTDRFRIAFADAIKIVKLEGFKRKYPGLFLLSFTSGFGDRMIALLNAMYLAKQTGFKFGFKWPTIAPRNLFNSNISKDNALEIIDIGSEDEFFSNDFTQKHSYSDKNIPLNVKWRSPKIDSIQNYLKKPYEFSYGFITVHMCLKYTIKNIPSNFNQEYAKLWNEIGFSKTIRAILQNASDLYFKNFKGKNTLALHIRSGDIVYSNKRIYHFFTYNSKPTPIEIALKIIEQNPSYDIVLFSDNKTILDKIITYYKDKNRNNLYNSSDFIPESLNNTQRAFFEIQFMSHFTKIYSPSGFARLASLLSRGEESLCWGQIFSNEQKYQIIKENFDKVVVHPLQSAYSLFCLFMFAREIGRPIVELKEILTKAMKLDNENALYPFFFTYCLMLEGNYSEANNWIREQRNAILKIIPTAQWKHIARNIANSNFEADKAIYNFPYICYFLAEINRVIGNVEKADDFYIAALNSDISNELFMETCKKICPEKYFKNLEKQIISQSQQLTQTKSQLDVKIKELDSKSKELQTLKSKSDSKIKELESNLKTSKDSIQSLNNTLNSLPIKKQTLEIKNLEQDLKIKELKTKQIEKELGYEYNVLEEVESKAKEIESLKQSIKVKDLELNKRDYRIKELELKSKGLESSQKVSKDSNGIKDSLYNQSAKDRIHNHLSYKLGKAMIENSKSLWGYIRMPYVLSYIKEQHNKEQKQYQERIKKNPKAKLPQLESYPDYKEALKEKECLTYKLGEAFIKANKTWYKGGYVKLWFEVRKLKKEFKK